MAGFINICKQYLQAIMKHRAVLMCILLVQIATLFCGLYLFSSAYGTYTVVSNIGIFELVYEEATTLAEVQQYATELAESDEDIMVLIYLNEDRSICIDVSNSRYAGVGIEPIQDASDKQTIAPTEAGYNIGDTVELLGNEYTVVGTYNWNEYGVNASSVDGNTPVYAMQISDYTIKNIGEQEDRIIYLQTAFDATITYATASSFAQYLVQNISNSISLIVVMCIAACGFTLGLQYFLKQSKKTIKAMRICGLSSVQAKSILILCGILLTTVSCIIGSLCYFIYYELVIYGSGQYVSSLTFGNYLIINLVMFIVPILSTLISMKNRAIREV